MGASDSGSPVSCRLGSNPSVPTARLVRARTSLDSWNYNTIATPSSARNLPECGGVDNSEWMWYSRITTKTTYWFENIESKITREIFWLTWQNAIPSCRIEPTTHHRGIVSTGKTTVSKTVVLGSNPSAPARLLASPDVDSLGDKYSESWTWQLGGEMLGWCSEAPQLYEVAPDTWELYSELLPLEGIVLAWHLWYRGRIRLSKKDTTRGSLPLLAMAILLSFERARNAGTYQA